MTISYDGERGNADTKTPGTTIGVNPSQAISAGQLLIVRCVTDNVGGSAGATTDHSVSDTQSNSYTRIAEFTQTGGSAGDGVTVSLHYCVLATGLGTGDTVTLTSSNLAARAIGLNEFTATGVDGYGGDGDYGTGDSPSVAISGLSSNNHLFIGLPGWEGKTSTSLSAEDSDYTSFATYIGRNDGGPLSCVATLGAYRIYDSSTGDTYAPTLGASMDQACILAYLYEPAGGSPQTINMGYATLTASPQALDVVPGATSVPMVYATLASSTQAADVIVGGASQSIDLNLITLASSSQTLDVIPGAISVEMGYATLASSPQSADVSVGGFAQTIDLGSITLSSSPQSIQVLLAIYYLRADGTASSKEDATGPGTSQSSCMSIATHNSERSSFSPGTVVKICDDGGIYRGALVASNQGTSSKPIIYEPESGDEPQFYGSNQITGWEEQTTNKWRAPCTVDPDQVWFIETDEAVSLGVEVGDTGSLASEYDWYYDGSTYLWCFATSDPDSRYSSVESGAINSGVITIYDYIEIRGIEVAFGNDIGILGDGSTEALVEYCTVHHFGEIEATPLGEGMLFQDFTDIVIQYCTFYQCGNHGIHVKSNAAASSGLIFQYNTLYNNYHSQFDMNALGGGSDTISDITIRYNHFYNDSGYDPSDTGGNEIYLSGENAIVSNIYVYYNLLHDLTGAGVNMAINVQYVYIYNNTFASSLSGKTEGMAILNNEITGCDHIFIKNNIGYDTYWPCLMISDSSLVDECENNLWYKTSGDYVEVDATGYGSGDQAAYKSATGWDDYGLWEDPDFVGGGDYSLSTVSPCINAGVDVSLTEDILGNPIVGDPDMGAYEFQSVIIQMGYVSLSASPQSADVSVFGGPQTVDFGAITLTGSAQSLDVIPGTVTVQMGYATLVSSPQTASVLAGASTINMGAVSLASSFLALDVVPGLAQVSMGYASASAQAQAINISVGESLVLLGYITLASSPQALVVQAGEAIVPLNYAQVSATPQSFEVISLGAPHVIPMGYATITGQAQSLSVSVDQIILLASITLVGSAQSVEVTAGVTIINLSAATLVSSAQVFDVIPGAKSLQMGYATLASSVQALQIIAAGAPQIIQLDYASLASSAVSSSIAVDQIVALSYVTLATQTIALDVDAPITLQMGYVELTTQTQGFILEASVSIAMVYASLNAVPQTSSILASGAPLTIWMNAIELIASPQSLTLIVGAIFAQMSAVTLTASPQSLTLITTGPPQFIVMDYATLASQILAIAPVAGGTTIQLGSVSLQASPQSLALETGAIAIVMGYATLVASSQILTAIVIVILGETRLHGSWKEADLKGSW